MVHPDTRRLDEVRCCANEMGRARRKDVRKDSGEVERALRFGCFLAHFGETKFKPIYFGDYASSSLEAVLTNYGCEA